MPAYLRIHRFGCVSMRGMPPVPGYTFNTHGIPSISPIAQGRFMRAVYNPSLAVRIDGKSFAKNEYEKPGRYIDGSDIGVRDPARELLSPKGPQIAQCWYEVQPGSHRLVIAAIYWFEQSKPGLCHNIDFNVEPDGVCTLSCQWQNSPDHLLLICGENVVISHSGRISPSGDSYWLG